MVLPTYKPAHNCYMYIILSYIGVEPTAILEDIRKAYKKRAIKYHPDKYKAKDAADKEKAKTAFQKIAFSVEILTDPLQRPKYDRELRERGEGGMKTTGPGTSSCGSGGTTFTPPPPEDRTYRLVSCPHSAKALCLCMHTYTYTCTYTYKRILVLNAYMCAHI
ncbi:J domain-containing protein [archaeon]|nr:MAG: J domain-containing protein [archaeon]